MDKNGNTSPTDPAQATGQSGTPPTTGQAPTTTPTTTTTPPPQAGGSGDQQQQQQQQTLTVDELWTIVKDLRGENAKYRTKAKEQETVAQAAERERQAAEQRRLEQQGQYKELAEQHALKIKELEPKAQSYQALAELIAAQIATQVKDWPAEVKVFDPGEQAPVEDRLSWMERSKPLIEKLTQTATTASASAGNRPTPRPAGSPTPEDLQASFIDKLRASGKYGGMR